MSSINIQLIFENGVKKIWQEDSEFQLEALTIIVEGVRKIPENLRNKYVEYLKNLGAFYVPHEDYMREMFGEAVTLPNYSIYNTFGYCNYNEKLIIPIRGLDDNIKALCAYDNGEGNDSYDFAKYVYSNDLIWTKNNYCFISRDEYIKAYNEGYICIVDGLFDKISLTMLGVNAVSLMSSNLSETNKKVLDFIPRKIVVADNDTAGKKLEKKCKKFLSNVDFYRQGQEWDIDDYLKTETNQKKFKDNLQMLLQYGYYL